MEKIPSNICLKCVSIGKEGNICFSVQDKKLFVNDQMLVMDSIVIYPVLSAKACSLSQICRSCIYFNSTKVIIYLQCVNMKKAE